MREGRFGFGSALTPTPGERGEPVAPARREFDDGAVAAIADQTTLTYVLHLGRRRRLHVHAAAGPRPCACGSWRRSPTASSGRADCRERNFVRLFPEQRGPPRLAARRAEGPRRRARRRPGGAALGLRLRRGSTAERLASFHRVENTYLSTFQMLGGLGLALGTGAGGGAPAETYWRGGGSLRCSRGRLQARPFRADDVAENALLLAAACCWTGALCALPAIARWSPRAGPPAVRLARGAAGGGRRVGARGLSGATAAALRSPLLSSLREGVKFFGHLRPSRAGICRNPHTERTKDA